MADVASEALIVRREPPLAWMIVNRPAAHNALNAEVWRGLADAAEALSRDDAIRVVILRGAGDKAFLAGADISEFEALRANAEMAVEYDRLSARTWSALLEARQPVIAMVNGLCYGGGVSIALACDLRFAASEARFAIPAARLGLSYPMQAVERLVDVVGPAHAAHLLLSAEAIDAEEARRIGLVNRSVARADLERVTREYALGMAKGAPLTLQSHKLAIRQALLPRGERDLAAMAETVRRCFDSADYREGVAAFLDKRAPEFRGR